MSSVLNKWKPTVWSSEYNEVIHLFVDYIGGVEYKFLSLNKYVWKEFEKLPDLNAVQQIGYLNNKIVNNWIDVKLINEQEFTAV
jgi:hypothetical protein